ncbi:MAG: hypothetical protein M1151_01305 [Candidatus Thermoplasmatota archaeon]|jgi:Arc/MetJ-type ribon-helix-helix transcriptional regulator|nr:hypothetical protein [Candidatus Thermoplasmatota archaeon]
MPIVSVRLNDDDKRRLESYGPISQVVREGLKLFLNSKKRVEALSKLDKLQHQNVIKTKSIEDLKLIREDRSR